MRSGPGICTCEAAGLSLSSWGHVPAPYTEVVARGGVAGGTARSSRSVPMRTCASGSKVLGGEACAQWGGWRQGHLLRNRLGAEEEIRGRGPRLCAPGGDAADCAGPPGAVSLEH